MSPGIKPPVIFDITTGIISHTTHHKKRNPTTIRSGKNTLNGNFQAGGRKGRRVNARMTLTEAIPCGKLDLFQFHNDLRIIP